MAANVNLPEGFVLDQTDQSDQPVQGSVESSNNLPEGFVLDNPNTPSVQPQTEDVGALKSGALGLMSGVPGAETALSAINAIGPSTYDVEHQKLEELKDKAWEQHPVAYGTGKVAGFAGTGLVAPEGLAGMALTGAGYGADVAKNISDIPKEATIGGVTGAVGGKILNKVIEPIVGSVGSTLESGTKGALASLGKQTTVEDIEKYLTNPNLINSAATKEEIATKLANLTSDIGTASGHLSQEARSMLSPSENPLDIANIKDAALQAVKKYFPEGNPLTQADENAAKAIINQYQFLQTAAEGNNGVVPETTLRTIVDRIQAATKESTYGNPEAGTTQTALKEFGGHLNALLRGKNPNYAEAMAPSAEAAELSSNLQDLFGIEKGQATDKTFGKINNLLKEGKPEELNLAEKLKDLTGIDIVNELKNAQTKENFNAEGPGNALKLLMTGLGYGTGRMTGIPGGGIGGAAIGRYAAESIDGGAIAGRILDSYLNFKNFSADAGVTQALQTYGPVLVNAAKQGGNNLAATHFVLATSHPEYQKVMNHFQNEVSVTNPQK